MSTTRRGFLGALLSLPVIGPWLGRKPKRLFFFRPPNYRKIPTPSADQRPFPPAGSVRVECMICGEWWSTPDGSLWCWTESDRSLFVLHPMVVAHLAKNESGQS